MMQNRPSFQTVLSRPFWLVPIMAFAFALPAFLLPGGVSSAADKNPQAESLPLLTFEVFPPNVTLRHAKDHVQLVVTGETTRGMQDLTRAVKYESSDPGVVEVRDGVVYPRGNGRAELVVRAAGRAAVVSCEVTGFENPHVVSFEYETLAALSKQGCNSGACHGSPSGKGGFRLSLRAFDSAVDRVTLIREDFGRRTNPLQPESSLLLAKPLMKVAHGGGLKLTKKHVAYTVLLDWISQGCQLDPKDAPRCTSIEVYPPSGRVLKMPAHEQQLSVLAHFSDGTTRDVTDLAVYSSSDDEVASVDESGWTEGHDRGEVAIIVRYLEFIESTYITFVRDVEGFKWSNPTANNYIDDLVYGKLRQLRYLPADICTDDEFLRRAHLDVIGVLPTVEESQAFVADQDPEKRAKLIDRLLERPEYARYWALKWGDLLRMTQKAVGADGLHKYHRWLERSFRDNKPFDQFAQELLTAAGSTDENPPANFYRTTSDANDCVETISQIFLGARLQCAKCHNHPFERWTQDNYYGMAAFFNRLKREKTNRPDEIFIWVSRSGEVTQPRTGRQMKPWLPNVGELDLPGEVDRRQAFAKWLAAPDNAFLAKVGVNRMWGHLVGRGIVDPVDDFRDSNPPSNAALLEALAKDFVDHGFDRKHILRTILNSRTYQASSQTNTFNQDDDRYFSHYQPRLLSAEQLLDAIGQVTGAPESFAALPAGMKATQLPSPDIVKNEFLKIFGQPERQTVCACERSSDSNLGQALQLFNGKLIHDKLRQESNRFRKLLAEKKSDEEIVTELYMAAFSRTPNAAELAASIKHLASKDDRVSALEDICWAILNTNEFLFQH